MALSEFQSFLINKGYVMCRKVYKKSYNYEIVENYANASFSTMSDVNYRFFKSEDVLQLIRNKQAVPDEITSKEEIIFGLNEKDKPPTLVWPRPIINVCRKKENGYYRWFDNVYDDSMNIVLKEIPFDIIYAAMFDKRIEFKFLICE